MNENPRMLADQRTTEDDRIYQDLVDYLFGDNQNGSSERAQISLAERIKKARSDLADAGERQTTGNELYGQFACKLGELGREAGRMVPFASDECGTGYLNPKWAFDAKLHDGGYSGGNRTLRIKENTRAFSRVWNGERVVRGSVLACNIVLLAVLDDAELREAAFEAAHNWIQERKREFDDCGGDLL